jgi:hypothetical protein
MRVELCSENLKRTHDFRNQGAYGRIILRWILKKIARAGIAQSI